MDIIYEIRRRHSVQKQTVSAIAREMGLSRPAVRKHLNTIVEPRYARVQQQIIGLFPVPEAEVTKVVEELNGSRGRWRLNSGSVTASRRRGTGRQRGSSREFPSSIKSVLLTFTPRKAWVYVQ